MSEHDPGHLTDAPIGPEPAPDPAPLQPASSPGGALPAGRAPRRVVPLLALVLAIVALVLAFVPYACFAAGVPALAAIVLGFVGLVTAGRRPLAGTALAIGAFALVAALVISTVQIMGPVGRLLATANGIAGEAGDGSTAQPSSGASTAPGLSAGAHTVVYETTGDGTAAISYSAVVEGSSGFDREASVALPHRREQRITAKRADAFDQFVMIVVAHDASKPIGCRITIDGAVVSERSSTTSSATQFVSCTAHTALP